MHARKYRERGAHLRRDLRELARSPPTTSPRRSASRASAIVVAHPGIGAEFTARRRGRRPRACRTCSPSRRSSRARTSARSSTRSALLADTGLALAVAGGAGWGEQPQLDRPGVVRLGRVSDEELARLYRGAAAVVYPSRFEGFGMPITEAMACGAPVVASSHPSLDEACGDAAVRADPESAEAFAAAIRDALGAARRAAREGARARGGVLVGADRRALPRGVPAILVGIDTTPLRADARRHGALPPRPARRTSTCAVQRGCRSRPRRGCARVAADALWYPRLARRRRRRAPLPDASAGRSRSKVPLVVTVHDLAVLRQPEWFNRWTRTYSRHAVPRVVARRDARDRRLRVHEARARRAARRARGEDPRRAERGRGRLHARGPARRGRLRARGRDARAAQEPARGSRPPSTASCASSARRGWGSVEPPANVVLARRGRRRGARRASTAARAASSTRRSTRASGSRSPRRSPAAARS